MTNVVWRTNNVSLLGLFSLVVLQRLGITNGFVENVKWGVLGIVVGSLVFSFIWLLLMVVDTSPTGVQPKGRVKPYPPRHGVIPHGLTDLGSAKPLHTKCAYCGTAIVAGDTATSCVNCGASIVPVIGPRPGILYPDRTPTPIVPNNNPPPRCLEWEELVGDSGILASVCTRYADARPSKVPPPGPNTRLPSGSLADLFSRESRAVAHTIETETDFKVALRDLETSVRQVEESIRQKQIDVYTGFIEQGTLRKKVHTELIESRQR